MKQSLRFILFIVIVFTSVLTISEISSMAQQGYQASIVYVQNEGFNDYDVEANQVVMYGKKKSHPNKPWKPWKPWFSEF